MTMNLNLGMEDIYEQNEQDQGSFAPLPAGDYPVIVDNAEYKQFASGNFGVNVTMSVYGGGQYDNKKVFDTFMFFRDDQVTEMTWTDKSGVVKNIGKLTYGKLCSAADFTPQQAGDPINLIGKMLTVKTKMGTNSNGEPDTKVGSYKKTPVAGAAQSQGHSQPQRMAPQTSQAGNAFARR